MSADERTSSSTVSPLSYNSKDVLIGRFKFCRENGGNEQLRQLVENIFVAYEAADKSHDYQDDELKQSKEAINKEIVSAIKANGGRFLKINNATKVCEREVSEQEALTRVVQEFKKVRRHRKSSDRRDSGDQQPVIVQKPHVAEGQQPPNPPFDDADRKPQGMNADQHYDVETLDLNELLSSDDGLCWRADTSVVDKTHSFEKVIPLQDGTSNHSSLSHPTGIETSTDSMMAFSGISASTDTAMSWNVTPSILDSAVSIETLFSTMSVSQRNPVSQGSSNTATANKAQLPIAESLEATHKETKLPIPEFYSIRESMQGGKGSPAIVRKFVLSMNFLLTNTELTFHGRLIAGDLLDVLRYYPNDVQTESITWNVLGHLFMLSLQDEESFFIDTVARIGGVGLLFDALERFPTNREAQPSCFAAMPFLSRNPCFEEHARNRNGVKLVTQVMALMTNNVHVQQNGCLVLGNLAWLDEKFRKAIFLESGGVDLVVSAVRTPRLDRILQTNGCFALANLTHSMQITEKLAGDRDTVCLLISKLDEDSIDNKSLTLSSIMALGNLAAHEAARETIEEQGGIRLLISIMRLWAFNEDFQTNLCLALSNLAIRMACRTHIVNDGGIVLLLAAMERFRANLKLCCSACLALGNLAKNDPAIADRIGDNGGIERVVEARSSFLTLDDDFDGISCFAVEVLAGASKKNRDRLEEALGEGSLIRLREFLSMYGMKKLESLMSTTTAVAEDGNPSS